MTLGKIQAIKNLEENAQALGERLRGYPLISLVPHYNRMLGAYYGVNSPADYLSDNELAKLWKNDFPSYTHDRRSSPEDEMYSPGGMKHLQWVFEVNTDISHEDDGPIGQTIRVLGTIAFTFIAFPAEEIPYRAKQVWEWGNGMVL